LACPVLRPTDDTRRLLESWVEPAVHAGVRVSVTDLLMARLAHGIGALWSKGRNVGPMASLGPVHCYGE
jgi:hypothetical protein